MRLLSAIALVLLPAGAVIAAEVRPATEDEIASALAGCWVRELTFQEAALERAGYFNEHTLCFGPGTRVRTSSVGGNDEFIEGASADGTFEVEDGKLELSGSAVDGWLFESAELSCDVVMRPGVSMRLEGCIGAGGDLLTNMSFGWVVE